MRKILTTVCCILWASHLFATHIVGGVMSVEHVTGLRYRISLTIYRDCINGEAPFDDPALVGIFDKKTNQLMATYWLPLVAQEILPFAAASCQSALPTGCTDKALNQRVVLLDTAFFNNKEGYYLAYQRCCRNGIIRNIRNPGDAGIAIYAEIPSPRYTRNSTPVIGNNPNILLCQEKLTTYNFGFTDADGDELRYSMTSPLRGNLTKSNPQANEAGEGPYATTDWVGGYSNSQQIQGNPSLTINAITGEMNVSPAQVGTYAIALKVEEFRSGTKIGEIILELQLNVAPCFQPAPVFSLKDGSGKDIKNSVSIQTPNTACFNLTISDPSDSLYVTIENISDDSTLFPQASFQHIISGFKNITTPICWESACSLPLNSTQKIRVNVRDNGCPKFASATYDLTLRSIPLPNHNPTDLLCMTLSDDKQTSIYWGDSTPMTSYFKHYNLYRRIDDGPFILLDSIQDKNTRFYTDPNTPNYSSINYQYFMRSVNQCGNIGLSSDTMGTFEQLKFIPDKQYIVSVSVSDNQSINISWPKTWEKDFARYFVYKKEAGNKPYQLLYETSNINDTIVKDKNVDVATSSYCYHVIMKDTCDNYGPQGYEACSILLKGKASPFQNDLSWNPYDGWCNGVSHYEIQSMGDKMLSPNYYYTSEEDTGYADDQLDRKSRRFSYEVIAHQSDKSTTNYADGNTQNLFYKAISKSNRVEFSQRPNIHVPNAFTPNNDQINDTWNIRDVFIKDYKLMVYNKWGQLIFMTEDKNNQWTGKSLSGDDAPTDVYIYLITYSGYDESTSFSIKGNVTLLR